MLLTSGYARVRTEKIVNMPGGRQGNPPPPNKVRNWRTMTKKGPTSQRREFLRYRVNSTV